MIQKNRILSLLLAATLLVAAGCTSSRVTSKSYSKKTVKAIPKLPKTEPLPALTTDSKSLLWEISGNGLEQVSYLFGTIHMIEKKDFFMTDVTKDRFNRTQVLFLELDMDDPSVMMAGLMGVFMNGGTSLKDLVTEEEYERIDNYFKEKTGMGVAMFDRMKPLLVSSLVQEKSMTGEVTSYESVFMEMANKRGMEVEGLETAEFQMSMFDSIPYKQQAQMLLDGVDGKDGVNSDELFAEMIELYQAEDIDGLASIISEESADMENFEKLLLETRNRNWIPLIGEQVVKMPTFFAVGAGHLGGKNGVVQLLKDAGYTMTPLKQME